jgi:hypothetical protein
MLAATLARDSLSLASPCHGAAMLRRVAPSCAPCWPDREAQLAPARNLVETQTRTRVTERYATANKHAYAITKLRGSSRESGHARTPHVAAFSLDKI